jgi:hypothetical protein
MFRWSCPSTLLCGHCAVPLYSDFGNTRALALSFASAAFPSQLERSIALVEASLSAAHTGFSQKQHLTATYRDQQRASFQQHGILTRSTTPLAALQSAPHLVSLSDDSLVSGQLVHALRVGVTRVGRLGAAKAQDIVINAVGIQPQVWDLVVA